MVDSVRKSQCGGGWGGNRVRSLALAAALAPLAMGVAAGAAATYQLTPLGFLGTFSYPAGPNYPAGNYTSSGAYGINNNGQIVGTSSSTTAGAEAFIYNISSSSMTGLGYFASGSSHGSAINDSAQAVGYSQATPTVANAFSYSGSGPMQNVGTVSGSGTFSWATGVSNSGQVVGYSVDSGTINPFIYTSAGGIQSLTAALGANAVPWGINGNNQIVGHYSDPSNGGATSAFIYNLTSHSVTSLGEYSSGTYSVAKAINSSGEVVGYAEDSNNVFHAFTSQGSGMTIFDPAGSNGSYALGINDSGLVVGYYKTSSGGYSAFEYNGTTVTDLNTIGYSAWVDIAACHRRQQCRRHCGLWY